MAAVIRSLHDRRGCPWSRESPRTEWLWAGVRSQKRKKTTLEKQAAQDLQVKGVPSREIPPAARA